MQVTVQSFVHSVMVHAPTPSQVNEQPLPGHASSHDPEPEQTASQPPSSQRRSQVPVPLQVKSQPGPSQARSHVPTPMHVHVPPEHPLSVCVEPQPSISPRISAQQFAVAHFHGVEMLCIR